MQQLLILPLARRTTYTTNNLLSHPTSHLLLTHPRHRRSYASGPPHRDEKGSEVSGKKTGGVRGMLRRLVNWPMGHVMEDQLETSGIASKRAETADGDAGSGRNVGTVTSDEKAEFLSGEAPSKTGSMTGIYERALSKRQLQIQASKLPLASDLPTSSIPDSNPNPKPNPTPSPTPKHPFSTRRKRRLAHLPSPTAAPTSIPYLGGLTKPELTSLHNLDPKTHSTSTGYKAEQIILGTIPSTDISIELVRNIHKDLKSLLALGEEAKEGEKYTARLLFTALSKVGIEPDKMGSVKGWVLKKNKERALMVKKDKLRGGTRTVSNLQLDSPIPEQIDIVEPFEPIPPPLSHDLEPPHDLQPQSTIDSHQSVERERDTPPHMVQGQAQGKTTQIRIGGMDMAVVRKFHLSGKKIQIQKVDPIREAKVANLSRGLDRVLFNPSVYCLRDPHSLVYNFSPSLEVIPRPEEFAFDRLPQYVTASKDPELLELAVKSDCKFYGSTSTLTSALSQIYFHISGNRPVDISRLSTAFGNENTSFTVGAKLPAKLIIRVQSDGRYAVDNDKTNEVEEATILSDLGRVMEKLLTSEEKDMKRFLKSSPDKAVSEEERNEREAYYYSKGSSLLMRSQLDCHDDRLPGTGTFDIKTRAAITVRHDRCNHAESGLYDIPSATGLYESFERELYDMTRSAFLKYSLQVRIGNMDGIFVAYHNSKRIMGFQYIPLREMNRILHGSDQMGEQAFKLSVSTLEHILQEATDCFPGKTISLVIEHQERSGDLVAFVKPEDESVSVEGVKGVSVVALTAQHVGRLNQKAIYGGGGVRFENNEAPLDSIDWTLDVNICKTPLTDEGVAFARRGREAALQRHSNMNELYVPAGKTAKEMNEAGKEEELKALKAIRKEKRIAKASVADETEADGAEEKLEAIAPPLAPRVKWKDPTGMVQRLRTLAAESGKRYDKRIRVAGGKKPVVWAPSTPRG